MPGPSSHGASLCPCVAEQAVFLKVENCLNCVKGTAPVLFLLVPCQ